MCGYSDMDTISIQHTTGSCSASHIMASTSTSNPATIFGLQRQWTYQWATATCTRATTCSDLTHTQLIANLGF
jgi:hypothetical protein